ncbi:hypothetical protein KUTeg_005008 [Tegillarca granosa]|uniref:Fibronectin type-III domain-containing protein n=1 Tax=Tegillarca granosa TaxID=220873 RepID=A0ABQ9FII8_TEGGR|nr:hypothetical protein KUTeg_005008 [Tegillarca granosa]
MKTLVICPIFILNEKMEQISQQEFMEGQENFKSRDQQRFMQIFNKSNNDSLPRPNPPIVGKVTHYSIDLYWDETLDKAMELYSKQFGRIKVCLQEKDKHGQWGNIYTGYSKKHTVMGLDPQTEYCYRMRLAGNEENSEWSAHVVVSTTKDPLTGEHLHKAIIRQNLPEIERILDTGEVKVDVPDKYGFTGLMQASQKGYLDIVELLLSRDADVHCQNDAGKSALMLACYAGQLDVVKKLREHGARYTDHDKGGTTPLHWAVDSGNAKLVDWMISDGADVNVQDHQTKWTPLIRCASLAGNREVALTLLVAGANIDAQDRDGKTALMVAIINGHQQLVELLLQKNANLKVTNEYGKTALDMARSMEKRVYIYILKCVSSHLDLLAGWKK